MPGEPEILITGSNGRIARAVRPTLGTRWTVAGIRRHPPPTNPTESSWESFFTASVGSQVKAVLDLAWSTTPATAETMSRDATRTDLARLDRLAGHLLARQGGPPLLIFFSSGSIYGPTPGRPAREDDEPRPLGAYACAKLNAEERLQRWQERGLPVCILRVANPYGLASRPADAQGVISHLIRHALAGTTFTRWGDDPVKDYLHRDDLARALELVLDHRLEGTWNLGTGRGTALSELVAGIEAAARRPLSIDTRPAAPWDASPNVVDPGRLTAATGWQPQHRVEDSLPALVEEFRHAAG